MIEIYRNREEKGIVVITDEPYEKDFINAIAVVFDEMVKSDRFDYGGWDFFDHAIRSVVDICCKYRGYKNSVEERRQLLSGDAAGFFFLDNVSIKPIASTADGAVRFPALENDEEAAEETKPGKE